MKQCLYQACWKSHVQDLHSRLLAWQKLGSKKPVTMNRMTQKVRMTEAACRSIFSGTDCPSRKYANFRFIVRAAGKENSMGMIVRIYPTHCPDFFHQENIYQNQFCLVYTGPSVPSVYPPLPT